MTPLNGIEQFTGIKKVIKNGIWRLERFFCGQQNYIDSVG